MNIMQIKEQYLTLFPEDDLIAEDVVAIIEHQLQVKLPADFKEITQFFGGGLVGGISIFSLADHTPNIVEETLRLRKTVNFPSSLIFLAEPPESMIVLDTANHPAVIWCDSVDVYQLQHRSFQVPPDTWNTFIDFFAYLLMQEE